VRGIVCAPVAASEGNLPVVREAGEGGEALLAAAGLSFSMSCLPAIGWSPPDDGALVLAALVVLAPTAAERPTSRQTILRVMRIMTTSSRYCTVMVRSCRARSAPISSTGRHKHVRDLREGAAEQLDCYRTRTLLAGSFGSDNALRLDGLSRP